MRESMLGLAMAWMFFGCAATVASAPEPTATSPAAEPDGIVVMTVDEVMKEVDQGAFLVDSRSPEGYGIAHIPGAVNIPCTSQTGFDQLPADRSQLVIFYCGGPQCPASHIAALRAQKMGYERVGEFKGGFPAWIERTQGDTGE